METPGCNPLGFPPRTPPPAHPVLARTEVVTRLITARWEIPELTAGGLEIIARKVTSDEFSQMYVKFQTTKRYHFLVLSPHRAARAACFCDFHWKAGLSDQFRPVTGKLRNKETGAAKTVTCILSYRIPVYSCTQIQKQIHVYLSLSIF